MSTMDNLHILMDRVIDELKACYDPEITVNIYDLGLIYDIDIDEEGVVKIKMTLTSPACPVAEILPHQVQRRIAYLEGVKDAQVDVVWEPPWDPSLMTEDARLELGMM